MASQKIIEIEHFAHFLKLTHENINEYDFKKPLTSIIISQNYRSLLEDCMVKCDGEMSRLGLFLTMEHSVDDLKSILLCTRKRIETITEIFINIPRNLGKAVTKEIYYYFVNFFNILNHLPAQMKIPNNTPNITKHVYLICETCSELSGVSKNNKEAVLRIISNQLELVEDAYVELDQHLDSEDAFENILDNGYNVPPQWNEEERNFLNSVLGLIKCTKSVLRKLISGINETTELTETHITSLDELSTLVINTSGKVDDLVLASYPPLYYEELNEEVQSLAQHLKAMLNVYASSFFKKESHKSWIDFLKHAIDHNSNKILNPLPELQNLSLSEDSPSI